MAGIRGGKLYIGEHSIVFWGEPEDPASGLFDNSSKTFINGATVTYALKNSAGSTVAGGTGTCSYIEGSQGCYEGFLDDSLSLTENSTYYLEVTATSTGGTVGFRRIPYVATYHGAD